MVEKKLFNRGIASGEAFCNRTEELERLVKNIDKLTHSLLVSPRRYGKTSLALRAIARSGLPYAHIDLFMKCDATSVVAEFFQGMGSLTSKIIKPNELALRKLESLLKNLSVSLSLGEFGFEFNLTPKNIDSQKNIKSLLISIDEILLKNKKQAIIFIDEIQAIIGTEIGDEVESALRFVAQKTNNIIFIFSGSSRHLLGKIFDDRSRPLYKLCHKMAIHRISVDHYKTFINKFAKIVWKQPISDSVLDEIFSCTQLHTYYINILCGYLFELDNLPTEGDVITCWKRVCSEEQSSVAKEIEFLTLKQKQLLNEIAKHPGLKEPTAKSFVKNVNLTPKGVSGAIDVLLKHDLIEKLETGVIRIVDPVLDYWSK